MSTNVVMPQMGESIAEGTIVRWIKKVGDDVDRDEPLFEISTDKVDAEIPSPVAGRLAEILVKEGETVPVNSVVAVIGAAGEVVAEAPAADPAARAASGRRGDTDTGDAAAGASSGRRGRRRRRARCRRRAPAEVVAARAPDRARAQRRHHEDSGHRDQRPRDQAGHPRLSSRLAGPSRRRWPRQPPPRACPRRAARCPARSTGPARAFKSCR